MGNEYTAADFVPHLIYPLTITAHVVKTVLSTAKLTILSGGHHQKLRLRAAYTLRVDTLNDTTAGVLVVTHGGNTVTTITEGAVNDPIGHYTAGVVVDQYKDCAAADSIECYFSTAPGQSALLLFLLYELVE